MAIVATPKTALLTGMVAAFIMYFLGPYVDHAQGLAGDILLLATALLVGLPACFLVFGLTKDQLVGLWIFDRELLKRMGAWVIGVFSTATAFQFLQYVIVGR